MGKHSCLLLDYTQIHVGLAKKPKVRGDGDNNGLDKKPKATRDYFFRTLVILGMRSTNVLV